MHETRHFATINVSEQHIRRRLRKLLVHLVGRPAKVRRQNDVRQLRQRVPGRQRLVLEHVQSRAGNPPSESA